MSKTPQAETRRSRKARTAPHQQAYDNLLVRLVKAREESGMSQREVCAKMSMPHSFLSKCETGDRRIDIMEFLQLAKLYNKPLSFFTQDGRP